MLEPIAPTLAELVDRRASISLDCPACRVLSDLSLAQLCPRFAPDTRVDRIRFRCERMRKGQRCGERLQIIARGPGNALLGFPQIWPPTPAPAGPLLPGHLFEG